MVNGTKLLSGIRILEICTAWAGPHAAQLLSDLGAQVIKVEGPEGDLMRGGKHPPPGTGVYLNGIRDPEPWNRNAIFDQMNRGKLSVGVDLYSEQGYDLLIKLIGISDLVICNLSVGATQKLKLGYENIRSIKENLILVTLNAYGDNTPWAKYRAYGVALEPMCGFFSLTGYEDDERPIRSGVDHLDPIAGTHLAGAALAALLYRKRTGKGQHIAVSFLESAINFIGTEILEYTANGKVRGHIGNRNLNAVPTGCYKCLGEDQWIAISITNDIMWHKFCRIIDDHTLKDEKFETIDGRRQYHNELDNIIEIWTSSKEKNEATRVLQAAGVAAGPVLEMQDLITDSHLRERGFFQKISNPLAGTYEMIGGRMKLSGSVLDIKRPSPRYGEHNEYVFGELLHMKSEEITHLTAQGIILIEPSG